MILPAAGVLAVWAVRPGVVENAARSPLAWVVVVGGIAAAVGARAAATRLGASSLLARGLSAALVVGLVAVVLAPSFRQRTLVEDVPADLLAGAAGPPATAPDPSTPVKIPAILDRTGQLEGIGHTAQGRVHLRTSGVASYLVFDDVDIEGSVGPSVHLLPEGRREPGGGGVRLGALKAERGTFTYRLPSTVDLTRRWSVLVWCDPYDTPIAAPDPR